MIFFNCLQIVFIILIFNANVNNAANILAVFMTVAKSHLVIQKSVINGLVERGHNVTVITALPLGDKNPKYEHIIIELPEHQKQFIQIISEYGEGQTFFGETLLMNKCLKFFAQYAAAAVQHEKMQEIFMTRQYDLVILGYLFNEVQLGIAEHFKCPVVYVWVNTNIINTDSLTGNPLGISYVPSMFLKLKAPMTFLDRTKNFLFAGYEKLFQQYILSIERQLYSELFPAEKNYRSFDDMLKNVSLVLQATHFSEQIVKPLMPNIIEIGGIQVKEKPDALPKNLQKFLDESKPSGAIYFCLGSNAKSSELDKSVTQSIFNVLSKLPQRVVWKWETDITPGKSSNIFYGKWLPQDDILAHPNIKLFISHGGLGGISEARHHAVPIVGLPIFGDQFNNLQIIESAGWAVKLDIKTLNEENFTTAIQEVLRNSTYRENIKRISRIYRDRPMSAMETAMFWIEYVVRHNGANHIQSPAVQLPFWELYSLDVILFLLTVIILGWIILKVFAKIVCNLFCTKNNQKVKIN